jgi:hypothetical protein
MHWVALQLLIRLSIGISLILADVFSTFPQYLQTNSGTTLQTQHSHFPQFPNTWCHNQRLLTVHYTNNTANTSSLNKTRKKDKFLSFLKQVLFPTFITIEGICFTASRSNPSGFKALAVLHLHPVLRTGLMLYLCTLWRRTVEWRICGHGKHRWP